MQQSPPLAAFFLGLSTSGRDRRQGAVQRHGFTRSILTGRSRARWRSRAMKYSPPAATPRWKPSWAPETEKIDLEGKDRPAGPDRRTRASDRLCLRPGQPRPRRHHKRRGDRGDGKGEGGRGRAPRLDRRPRLGPERLAGEAVPRRTKPSTRRLPTTRFLLTRIDGHANWANALAMEIAGVTGESESPEGGEIMRGADGQPTGVFIDNAETLVGRHVPDTTPERDEGNSLLLRSTTASRFGTDLRA